MMKRSMERRDFLSHLLTNNQAATGNISSFIGCDSGNNNDNDNAVAHLPARELKSLLMAVSAEYRGEYIPSVGYRLNKDLQTEEFVYEQQQQSRKRGRQSVSNNHHSILRFVERILERRYAKQRNTVDKNAQFLQNETQSYFGTNDTLLRAEEDILCLIFELAYDAIRAVACIDDDSDEITPSHLKSIINIAQKGNIIITSLRIIDIVIHVDKQQRKTHEGFHQSRMNRMSVSNQSTTTHKRQKYSHLLQQNNVNKDKGKQDATNTLPKKESLVQRRYPTKSKWLDEFRLKYSSIAETNGDDETKSTDDGLIQSQKHDFETQASSQFLVLRRKYESMDDISLSSTESSDQEMEDNVDVANTDDPISTQNDVENNTEEGATVDSDNAPASNDLVDDEMSPPLSPMDELDKESRELRTSLLDLPSGELASAQVVNQVTDTLVKLLNRYSDLSGTSGISHCGDVIAGNACDSKSTKNFPLNEEIVTSLMKSYLTSATGALRAKALLRSFVLPLVLRLNPIGATSDAKHQKPAPRSLTSLIVTIARDRPEECVDSILAPSLVMKSMQHEDWEPSRFQCELISRVLRVGRDSLSLPAIAQLVEKLLPVEGSAGVKWTDNTMTLLTTCLNRRPTMSDLAIGEMADEIIEWLSPNKCNSVEKSMKFATLFNALVTKYGPQLKTTSRVEPLIEAASRLKTFMSKTITSSLKKLQ